MSGSNANSGATRPPLNRAADSRVLVVDAQTRLAAAIPEADRHRAFQKTGLVLDAANILDVPIFTHAESVIFEWLTDAGHEHFGQVSALLK